MLIGKDTVDDLATGTIRKALCRSTLIRKKGFSRMINLVWGHQARLIGKVFEAVRRR
jgi:hypothetical protein